MNSCSDTCVNVGWGSKATQFHGSLGKEEAKEAIDETTTRVALSPDDDGRARVSWRGDAAFFVISSVDNNHMNNISSRHRVLRVYNRQGKLQSTSETVPGMEHNLSWKPSGSLIATTQRYGFLGCGFGPQTRHDVIFFERNGLRHGEFSLVEAAVHTRGATTVLDKQVTSYKVQQLLWNSDSSILAIWITREGADVGKSTTHHEGFDE